MFYKYLQLILRIPFNYPINNKQTFLMITYSSFASNFKATDLLLVLFNSLALFFHCMDGSFLYRLRVFDLFGGRYFEATGPFNNFLLYYNVSILYFLR